MHSCVFQDSKLWRKRLQNYSKKNPLETDFNISRIVGIYLKKIFSIEPVEQNDSY